MIALQGAIFQLEFEIVYKLQGAEYQTERLIAYRKSLVEHMTAKVRELNRENFAVRQHLKYVDIYAIYYLVLICGIINPKNIISANTLV